MSKYLEHAKELRAIVEPHYNCAQAVLVPFAKEAGISEETAYDLSRNFGGGMKIGSVCGAITGGLMVLGLFGVDDPRTVGNYYRHFKDAHNNRLNCFELLKASRERGEEKKPHCDGMVYEAIEVVEAILKEKGKL